MNMNSYNAQPSRGPRLQNTQKTALGNGLSGGWGMGLHTSNGGSSSAFGAGLGAGVTGAPGLQAHNRSGQLSGFAQVMGGGTGQSAIDMSDFPSLGGGPRQQAAGNWNTNTGRQPSQPGLQQQGAIQQPRAPSVAASQHSLDQLSQSAAERAAGGDDFPPLNNVSNGEGAPFGTSLGSSDAPASISNDARSPLPMRDASGTYQAASHTAIGSGQALSQGQQNHSTALATSSVKKYADMTEAEKWGLPGLQAVFEARRILEAGGQPDETIPPIQLSAFVMGQDLHTLGMDLESPDPLYPTFTPFPATNSSGSQFDFHDRHVVPDYTLPAAYTVTNVPPLSSRVNAFSDETLFTIFFQSPRDVNQELVAMELTARDWRYHKVLRQWLQKDSRESNAGSLVVVDLAPGTPVGTPSVRMGDRTERGVYIFFDQNNWRKERREFILDFDQLDNRHNSQAVTGGPGPNVANAGANFVGGMPPGVTASSGPGVGGLHNNP